MQETPPEGKGIGFEGSGLVVATSSTATELLNKKVALFQDPHEKGYSGLWRQYVYVNKNDVFVCPDDADYDIISSNFINPITVLGFIDIYNKKGYTGIVHNPASSSLGKMLIRYCKKLSIPLVNIVRSQEHVDNLKEFGAEVVLNSKSDTYNTDLAEALKGFGKVAFFDAVGGGEPTRTILYALPNKSVGYIYGRLGLEDIDVNFNTLRYKERYISSFWLSPYFKKLSEEEQKKWTDEIINDLTLPADESIFRSEVAQTFPLSKLNEAWSVSTKIASQGKVIIRPNDE